MLVFYYCLDLPGGFFSSGFLSKNYLSILIPDRCVTCPANLSNDKKMALIPSGFLGYQIQAIMTHVTQNCSKVCLLMYF